MYTERKKEKERERNEDIALHYQNLMDVAYRCAHVGGLGEMKKHHVESTQLFSSFTIC